MSHRHQKGLTLIEMLVALMIFATISTAGVSLIVLTTNGQARAEQLATDLQALERARSVIRNDLAQMIDRPYRVQDTTGRIPSVVGGTKAESIFSGDEDETILLAFVRHGWVNPGATEKRASLQHVTYVYRDDALVRRVRPYLDATPETPTRDDVLFDDITAPELAFATGDGWQADFVSREQSGLPRAVRIRFVHPVFGPLTQDFLVGGTIDG